MKSVLQVLLDRLTVHERASMRYIYRLLRDGGKGKEYSRVTVGKIAVQQLKTTGRWS